MHSRMIRLHYEYGKQNIKTNAGLYGILFLLLPMLTIPYVWIRSDSMQYLELTDISLVAGLFMFFTPIVVAITLYRFVFFRKQVDFICSLPLSRTTLYWTNYIIGALLLISSVITSALVIWLIVVIKPNMSMDAIVYGRYILFYSLGYLLVFSISVFCIACTGKRMTAVLLIFTLMFLPSVLRMPLHRYDTVTFSNLEKEEYVFENVEKESDSYVTILSALEPENQLVQKDVVYTMMICLGYTLVGYVVFRKRKMEIAQSTFLSQFAHDVSRALMLFFPLYGLFSVFDVLGTSVQVVLLLLLGVLFYLYDFVTNRVHHNWKRSIVVYLLVMLLAGGVVGAKNFVGVHFHEKIAQKDVKRVVLYGYSQYMPTNVKDREEIVIEDEEVIAQFLDCMTTSSGGDRYRSSFVVQTKWDQYYFVSSSKAVNAFVYEYLKQVDEVSAQNITREQVIAMHYDTYTFTDEEVEKILSLTNEEVDADKLIELQMKGCTNTKDGLCQLMNGYMSDTIYFMVYENGQKVQYSLSLIANPKVAEYVMELMNQKFLVALEQENIFLDELQITVTQPMVKNYSLYMEDANGELQKEILELVETYSEIDMSSIAFTKVSMQYHDANGVYDSASFYASDGSAFSQLIQKYEADWNVEVKEDV